MASVTSQDEKEFRRRLNQPRTTRVKNKAAAPIQITAEQILREAQQRLDEEPKAPQQRITDPEELAEYRFRKRKDFEDSIRRNRGNIGAWIKYAGWEDSQLDLERARSVYERALDVDYRNVVIWLKYAEMEMKHKNVNAARNIWDRAVTLLPMIDQLWLKYSYMEDILGNYAGARQVFERWMEWEPQENGWMAYVRFELRCGELERARKLYQRYVEVHPSVKSFLKWARFEEKQGDRERVRAIFEQALEYLGEEANDEKLFIAFAKFEDKCREVERSRAIYKYALDHIPKKEAQELYKMWISFEKKNGDREGIEDVIIGKRRFQYEEELKLNSHNYDIWFDYARLEEMYGSTDKVREVYERAIANLPPANEKRFWRRYIYLWVNYALFEELESEDMERARQVYKECIKILPHRYFSFGKIWLMFANFEIRQKDLQAARSVFGHAIGMYPRQKIFKAYIQLELQIGNVERCRAIYERWLEWNSATCEAWVAFAHHERDLGEMERGRAIFELAISQPSLDMPEILWKAYIDFEIDQEEYDRARELYKRLLDRTKHVKVWISFAQFEFSTGDSSRALQVYNLANDTLADISSKEERVVLLDSWKAFAEQLGDQEHVEEVQKKMPKKLIKRKALTAEDGTDAGWEEYYDYVFPGEEATQANLKLLERARQWKKQKAGEE